MAEIKQFRSLTDFILNAPSEKVEGYLREAMGEEKFNEYMKSLKEYEESLIHGTGSAEPRGLLNYGVKQ